SDMLELATESANAAAIIFLLPAFLFIVRDDTSEDGDTRRSLRRDETKRRQRSSCTTDDDENRADAPTAADFNATTTACCCYYSLVWLTAITSTSIVHHGILDTAPLLTLLTLIAWCSFLSCTPFALVRSLNADQWALSSFLLVLALAVLMNALDIFLDDAMMTDIIAWREALWIGMIVIVVIERAKIATGVTYRQHRHTAVRGRSPAPERSPECENDVQEALREELNRCCEISNNDHALSKHHLALNEMNNTTDEQANAYQNEELDWMEGDSNSEHDEFEDSHDPKELSSLFHESLRLQQKLDELSDRLNTLEHTDAKKRFYKFTRNNLRDTRRSYKK
ncbi:hypothetical protein PENTCL1PPCAC_1024, partial [Pristionchus entomophagus]